MGRYFVWISITIAVFSGLVIFNQGEEPRQQASSVTSEPVRPTSIRTEKLKAAESKAEKVLEFAEQSQVERLPQTDLSELYVRALEDLAEHLEVWGGAGEELLEEALSSPRELFLESLPMDLAAAFRRVFELADEMTERILEEDQMSHFSLEAPDLSIPYEIQKRSEVLDRVALPSSVHEFVAEVAQSDRVENADIEFLVHACDRDLNCVEASVKKWMDSNHLLTERQLEMIEQMLF